MKKERDVTGLLPKGREATAVEAIRRPALHVMVVDDDRGVRTVCLSAAEEMGFATVSAESLASARAVLKHRKVDLLLLDLKLPDGGGWSCWSR